VNRILESELKKLNVSTSSFILHFSHEFNWYWYYLQLLQMRLLPTRNSIYRELTSVCIDWTPQPVYKDEYPVRELDLRACKVFYMAGPLQRYQQLSAYLLMNKRIFCGSLLVMRSLYFSNVFQNIMLFIVAKLSKQNIVWKFL